MPVFHRRVPPGHVAPFLAECSLSLYFPNGHSRACSRAPKNLSATWNLVCERTSSTQTGTVPTNIREASLSQKRLHSLELIVCKANRCIIYVVAWNEVTKGSWWGLTVICNMNNFVRIMEASNSSVETKCCIISAVIGVAIGALGSYFRWLAQSLSVVCKLILSISWVRWRSCNEDINDSRFSCYCETKLRGWQTFFGYHSHLTQVFKTVKIYILKYVVIPVFLFCWLCM